MAKIRKGFVSNSSSSSFIIRLDRLTDTQIRQIQWHPADADDHWDISINDDVITGSTFMDNFDFQNYLDEIGVDREAIVWRS